MPTHLGKHLLSVAGKHAPHNSGIYFVCLAQAIRYDHGVSPLVYIGSAQNLRRRLSDHKRNSHSQALIQLQENYDRLIYCDLFGFENAERDTLYAVEEAALTAFHSQFGTLPLFNASVPSIPEVSRVVNPFSFGNPIVSGVIDPSDLAMKLFGNELERQIISNTIVEVNPQNKIEVVIPGQNFNAFRFPNKWQYQRAQEESRRKSLSKNELEEECRKQRLKRFTRDEVSLWSVNKICDLLRYCEILVPVKVNSRRIRKYRVDQKTTPHPHTWGEVAVAMAGKIYNTLCPCNEVIVKIVCGRDLLGTAHLRFRGIFAEDSTEEPQTFVLRERPLRKISLKEVPIEFGTWAEEIRVKAEAQFQKAMREFGVDKGEKIKGR